MATEQPIYLITDGGELRGKALLVERVTAALEAADGMVAFVQLREQVVGGAFAPASNQELDELISKLAPICRKHSAKLIVNRRPDLLDSDAVDGVHLGAPVEQIRIIRLEFSQSIIGYSAHSISEAAEAEAAGANYVLLSPIFPPLSKQSKLSPLGVEELARAAEQLQIPVYALGGLTAERLPACLAAGAAGAAMLSYVLLAENPAAAVREMVTVTEQVY